LIFFLNFETIFFEIQKPLALLTLGFEQN